MSTGTLKRWLGGAADALRWVEYDAYAGQVFAGAPADWLAEPARFANTLAQARKVVVTDVLTIDLTAPCLARMPEGGSAAERAARALADPSARAFGAEVLDALVHKFGADTDLALRIASPRDLLARAGAAGDVSFDELDDLASALAGWLRAVSDRPVAALLVARAGSAPWSADEADTCDPLFSAARHYGWSTALSIDAPLLEAADAFDGVDVLLCADAPTTMLVPGHRPRVGGGLPAAWWRGAAPLALPAGALAYGVIPVDAAPEHIVERCALLRS